MFIVDDLFLISPGCLDLLEYLPGSVSEVTVSTELKQVVNNIFEKSYW